MRFSNVVSISLIVLFLSPLLILTKLFDLNFRLDYVEVLWALKNSFIQASLSALVVVFFGFWAALGILLLSDQKWRWLRLGLEVSLLAPGLLPPLFVLLALLNFIDPFPFGILGVVIVHLWIYLGIVSVNLAQQIESQTGHFLRVGKSLGAGYLRLLSQILLPLLRRDLFWAYVFVFVSCFCSFSIPLAVGGGKGTTLEVLIYEKAKLSLDWGGALALAFIQIGILFFLSWLSLKAVSIRSKDRENLSFVGSRFGLSLIISSVFIFIYGYVDGVIDGFAARNQLQEIWAGLPEKTLVSFGQSFLVGVLTYSLLIGLASLPPRKWLRKFFAGYVVPSTALTAVAFLILPGEGILITMIKISLAILLISFSSIYRLGWDSEMLRVQRMGELAEQMGAGWIDKTRFVTWPLLHGRAVFLASISVIWAAGDFAVSRIIANQDINLAMSTESLMNGYRLGMASWLSLLVAAVALISAAIFSGMMYVFGHKFKS